VAVTVCPRERGAYDQSVILRCTRRLLAVIGPTLVGEPAPAPDAEDWYANLVWFDRRKCLLLTHAATLFSIFEADVRAADACPAQHVNQVLVQVGPPSESGVPDGIYVAVGSISPPVIPADPEGRAARVAELTASVVKVAVYGRVTMSRDVLDDLMRLLKLTADQYDAAVALARRPRAPEEG